MAGMTGAMLTFKPLVSTPNPELGREARQSWLSGFPALQGQILGREMGAVGSIQRARLTFSGDFVKVGAEHPLPRGCGWVLGTCRIWRALGYHLFLCACKEQNTGPVTVWGTSNHHPLHGWERSGGTNSTTTTNPNPVF